MHKKCIWFYIKNIGTPRFSGLGIKRGEGLTAKEVEGIINLLY